MDKTKTTHIELFLASQALTIKIDRNLTVGRVQGDIIMEDDEELSNKHCELIPRVMTLFIKDLDSSNGVYINSAKILPHTEVQLSPGDEVLFGKHRFVFLDSREELEKRFPKPDRRSHPRPNNLFSPKHLLNFHFATRSWLSLYIVAILLTIYSAVNNSVLNIPLPGNLQFLSNFYHEQILLSGIKAALWVWALSIIHSFFHINYFNRNIFRKVLSFGIFCILLFATVDLKNGPLWHIKVYVESRAQIEKENFGDKSIIRLKNVIDHQKALAKAFSKTSRQLDQKNLAILNSDFKRMSKKLDTEIMKLTYTK